MNASTNNGENMKAVTEKAYGKINLYLDVVGKRSDGYHNILSVMHTVGICDLVTVSRADGGIIMTCSDRSLSCGEDNLCVKAAKAFFCAVDLDGGCAIHLEKTIPMGAGMGGGSADAAAVLRALNTLYETCLSLDELCEIGVKIGADVPFCIVGGCKKAEGVGEILTDFPCLPECYIVVCEGGEKVSTPNAYRQIDLTPASRTGDFDGFEKAMNEGSLRAVCDKLYNRFEDTCPDSERIKDQLIKNGAVGALMTGSGSAVFGIFNDHDSASNASKLIMNMGIGCYITRPITEKKVQIG